MQAHSWPKGSEIWVRVGIHTGEGELGGDNYVGMDVNHAARIADSGHGGQIVLSGTTARFVRPALPAGLSIDALGVHRLKDFEEEQLYQLYVEGLRHTFPRVAVPNEQ